MKYRRSFIATLSLSAFAGCLSSNDDNGGTPTDTGGTPTDVTETATDADDGTETETEDGDDEAEPEILSEDITTDRTLSGETVYRVTDTLRVEAALTIEPGATLIFEEDTGLEIYGHEDGSIIADGTASEEIVFTASQETPGWWNGIFVWSEARNNRLNHVVVEYGGRNNEANIHLDSSTYLPLTNSTVTNSDGYGLYIDENVTMPDVDSNEYTENERGAVRVTANNLHYLDSESSYTGNTADVVVVEAETVSVEDDNVDSGAVTWHNLGVPYRVNGQIRVEDIEVTVDPGAVFRFEEGTSIQMAPDSALIAEGTPEEEIVFTATDDVPGWWDGIVMSFSESRKNILKHAIVEYGGRDTSGNVHVESGRIKVVDSTLRHSEALGLWSSDDGTVNDDVCAVNEYQDNAEGDCTIET
ncbi:hypothetical protein E6P09_15200 (plasmid) [Haloferax mediterranei ATCC 33500]|uniref:Right-handed parallel beta-helix repeat-containing protein n=2 Tax=Haloferax mediterranei TaxID=2252 RepID=I3RAD4_HALMT|nr:hypothetical protein [Haloferax mediterranei]AFK21194.1 hypothetical protein HFX_6067 [Haloferax mediterranei ATCC 33500]AHZ24693.1 hypothetical protein BM92_17580 [Haloferax mediterranei ATCC 33500]ELZ97470.1 hypothetical protein C439_19148 [Haloferax mediterranei ATCC 33500]MDX5990239.1 hypothetical protein [Haloferax mediterranei ATCC 33500]QCQ77073.1 hypothetical protein E6P09_15200 [Haloferax mediterranei ATCC 33500]